MYFLVVPFEIGNFIKEIMLGNFFYVTKRPGELKNFDISNSVTSKRAQKKYENAFFLDSTAPPGFW